MHDMETLELKNLSPYLPYKLKVYDTISNKSKVMNLGQGQSVNWVGVKTVLNYYKSDSFIYKPTLRPLSMFCGKITGGEVKEKLNCSFNSVQEIWSLNSKEKSLKDITYETYVTMCKNHIDFNLLIDKGLAIDINTI